jgi:hypothetical protein
LARPPPVSHRYEEPLDKGVLLPVEEQRYYPV